MAPLWESKKYLSNLNTIFIHPSVYQVSVGGCRQHTSALLWVAQHWSAILSIFKCCWVFSIDSIGWYLLTLLSNKHCLSIALLSIILLCLDYYYNCLNCFPNNSAGKVGLNSIFSLAHPTSAKLQMLIFRLW